VQELLQSDARQAFAEAGAKGAARLLEGQEVLARDFRLHETGCDQPGIIGRQGTTCLAMELIPGRRGLKQHLLALLVPLAIGSSISLGLALLLARRFSRPIRHIGRGLTALAAGDLSRRIGPDMADSEPAIADVGRAFDMAAGKLQELTENRSGLFHDISHEIRSPLARLQAETALLRQNPARLPAMLPRMEADIARMDLLVDEILTLARLERGGDELQLEPLDLLEVLDPILRDAEFEAQSRDVAVRYAGPERADLRGNAELLHRAFENILRNALRYSPAGGLVEVHIQRSAQSIGVAIRDQGPGVAANKLPRIFQAFVRDETGTGTGLGLAIAANAIRLHGGAVTAANRQGGGLEVMLVLPCTRNATPVSAA
jgi:two-component system OmpR family sensor kinase